MSFDVCYVTFWMVLGCKLTMASGSTISELLFHSTKIETLDLGGLLQRKGGVATKRRCCNEKEVLSKLNVCYEGYYVFTRSLSTLLSLFLPLVICIYGDLYIKI